MSETAFVEAVDLGALARHEQAWRALATRAAEPNVFGEPAFVLPALRRIAPRRGLTTLLVWSDATRNALIGVVVLNRPRLALARVWRSEQAGLAAMLFDRDALAPSLTSVAAWARARGLAGVIWPAADADGAVALAIRSLAEREGVRIRSRPPRGRAVLAVAGVAAFEAGLDRKRRKEWARQARRLGERGQLKPWVARDSAAIERFLALEAKGWKGARGTALSAETSRREFAREMLEAFAREGKLEVHELMLDHAPIASGIVLKSGARGFYWKTAYDERFAEFSPGVQLTLALSRALAEAPDLTLVDSCALANHPMIDRLWPGRLRLVDLALPMPGRRWRFTALRAVEQASSAARERLKDAFNRWLGRKRS